MANGSYLAALRGVDTLFGPGSIAGLTDAELVARIADGSTEAAELAFAAIVERHGPMVLRVCRAVLRDRDDAGDAFQATFLVLLRKARSIRDPASVASWLHGVALRVATASRTADARRRRHERLAASLSESASTAPTFDDSAATLHEELNRLPSRYLAPIVLCHLEGHTHEQAAAQLDWPVGTVRSRLARGRDQLRGRLIRRGLAPSIGIVAVASLADASLTSLTKITIRMASGAVPARVAAIVGDVLRTAVMAKIKSSAIITVAAGLFATGLVMARPGGGADEPKPAAKAVAPKPANARPDDAAIDRMLDRKVSVALRKPSPLEDAIKQLKESSKGPNDNGLPIYIDPIALQEVGATMKSGVILDVFNVSIKTALSATLKQLKLAFIVKDGLVMIGSRGDILEARLDRVEQKLDRILKGLDDLKREPRR